MAKNQDIFEPGYTFHIYNRAVGFENLFFQEKNYFHFLFLFYRYFHNHINIYAFVLMGNHYHFLAQVKETATAEKVSEAFRRFGISYSQAINKQEGRMGSLFMKPVKRIRVSSDKYFRNLVAYIHRNPFYHGISRDFRSYKWSSYPYFVGQGELKEIESIISNTNWVLKNYFEDEENFVFAHQNLKDYKGIQDLIIEED
jgi:putative transposase